MSGPLVVHEGDPILEEPVETDPVPVSGPVAVGPQSPLALLTGKRAALEATLHKDLAVPRWEKVLDGRVLWVRYRPGDTVTLADSLKRREEAFTKLQKSGQRGDPQWVAKANADVLVKACVAVYDLAPDEEPPAELPPNLPTFFSAELADALGAPHDPVSTVMKLYGTPEDVLLASNQLLMWSGEASKDAAESFLGDSPTST